MKNRDDASYFHLAAAARRGRGQDAAVARLLQALYRKDPAGRRGRRGHGDADRGDRRDGGVSLHVASAVIAAQPEIIAQIRCARLSSSNGLVIISMPGCRKPSAIATLSA